MAYREVAGGGRYYKHWCNACKAPIVDGEASTRIDFRTDPDGSQGLTGMYHTACSRVFQSLARVVNMNPWGRF